MPKTLADMTPDGAPVPGEWDVEETTFRDYNGTVIASNAHRRWISEWEPVNEKR